MQAGHGDFIRILPRELISRLPDAGNTNKPRISLANAGIVGRTETSLMRIPTHLSSSRPLS